MPHANANAVAYLRRLFDSEATVFAVVISSVPRDLEPRDIVAYRRFSDVNSANFVISADGSQCRGPTRDATRVG